MAYYDCVAISELHPNFSHPKVMGIIIAKTDVKSFPDRKTMGMERFTFGFTMRDSTDFFINVTAWGREAYIYQISNSVNIGDCVIVDNPLISSKDPEKDKFCPATPSNFRLLLSESHSQVGVCDDIDVTERLMPLSHLPVKDSEDFYSLRDIVESGEKLNGYEINILAVVKTIGDLKQFTTSDGRDGQRLEMKLFDNSVRSFPLICWDKEIIQLVQNLVPKETVLFIADAKVSFDNFRNKMVATVNTKSIITVNPDTQEAGCLFKYAKELSESGALDLNEVVEDMPVESITDVYTVSEIKWKANENPHEVFFGITFGFMSKLNLDPSVSKVIKTRCSKCKFPVLEGQQQCNNDLCPGKNQVFTCTTGIDLPVDITDHTGTLLACSLQGPVAEQTLGYTAEEFVRFTKDQKVALQWRYLMERCKIYIKVFSSRTFRDGIKVVILACALADPGEFTQCVSKWLS